MWGGCVGGVSVQIPPLNLEFGREGLKWKTSCLGPCPRPRDAWGATSPGHRSMCHSPPHTDRSTVGGSASKTGSQVDADLENGGDSRKLRAPERQRPLPGWLGREALSSQASVSPLRAPGLFVLSGSGHREMRPVLHGLAGTLRPQAPLHLCHQEEVFGIRKHVITGFL